MLASPAPRAAASEGEADPRLAGALREATATQAALVDRLEALEGRVAMAEEARSRAAAVQRDSARPATAEPLTADVASAVGAGTGEADAAPADMLEDLLAELFAPDADRGSREAVWKRIREAGLTDEAIAEYERLAELAPNDPAAQTALGGAYLQKIQEVGQSPEAGVWATKADQAFDRALGLDDHHWEARFTKAMSLSFWPPVFGKKGEAIQHFEILANQQEEGPASGHYAQTYLLLGNLYAEQGKPEKALQAWERGLGYFPGNESLSKQLQIHKASQ
jgi:tetratricopeptide (TPR) repeat protein